MLPALMLMLVLQFFAVDSAHACDGMTFFDTQMTETDQIYAAPSERLIQTNQTIDGLADGSATLGDGRVHPTRPMMWNSDNSPGPIDIGNGRVQTEFHINWINVLDKDLTRREIHPEFVGMATGVWR